MPSFRKDFEIHVRKTGEQSLNSRPEGESIFDRQGCKTQEE